MTARLGLLGLLAALAFLVAGPVGTASAVDCTATPSDPACTTPTPSPSPSPTATVTVTASPSPAPGEDSGVYVDPGTGSVKLDQDTFVAVGVVVWLASLVAGLVTARLVLP